MEIVTYRNNLVDQLAPLSCISFHHLNYYYTSHINKGSDV